MIPEKIPAADLDDIKRYAAKQGAAIDFSECNVIVVAYRYYWADMPKNNAYACACWVLWQEKGETQYKHFVFNTVPSKPNPKAKDGAGTAQLEPGAYWYKIGLHKKTQTALVQAAPVMVKRVGAKKIVVEKLDYSINFHRGGATNTWSEGCQTMPKAPFGEFITLVAQKCSDKNKIKYILCS